jgi:hypothetical protein
MEPITILYHFELERTDDDVIETWWIESDSLPGFTASGDTLESARTGLLAYLSDIGLAGVELIERLDDEIGPPQHGYLDHHVLVTA